MQPCPTVQGWDGAGGVTGLGLAYNALALEYVQCSDRHLRTIRVIEGAGGASP